MQRHIDYADVAVSKLLAIIVSKWKFCVLREGFCLFATEQNFLYSLQKSQGYFWYRRFEISHAGFVYMFLLVVNCEHVMYLHEWNRLFCRIGVAAFRTAGTD